MGSMHCRLYDENLVHNIIISAGLAVAVYGYADARHSGDPGADLGDDVGQHAPDAAAGTAVADCQELVARTDAQPNGVEFVAAYHVHQAGLAAAVHRGDQPAALGNPHVGSSASSTLDQLFQ